MKTETGDRTLKAINQYSGTQQYHNIMNTQVTDGIIYVCENGYSRVITDAVVILRMHKKVKGQEFVSVDLKVNEKNKTAKVVYSDGNNNILYTQKYDYTDAKTEFKMFYTNGVLMLAGEY